jgi:hypothetical protein
VKEGVRVLPARRVDGFLELSVLLFVSGEIELIERIFLLFR